MEKLISMTDFVLEEHKITNWNSYNIIVNYANFLTQPLTLGMFVPCDEEGNVLEKKFYPASMSFSQEADEYFKKYQQAKERCIFDGWELNQKDISKLENIICMTKNKIQITFFKKENGVFLDDLTTNKTFEAIIIEDLVQYSLTLTATAQKQIGI